MSAEQRVNMEKKSECPALIKEDLMTFSYCKVPFLFGRCLCCRPDCEAGQAGQVRRDLPEGEGGLHGQDEGHPWILRGRIDGL